MDLNQDRSSMMDRKHKLKRLIWLPILIVIIGAWGVTALIEQGYYYLKGYSWNPRWGGYWHRETNTRASKE